MTQTESDLQRQIDDLRRQVQMLERSARLTPARLTVGGAGSLPPGTGRFKVLAILDEGANPAKGWDDVRFRSGEPI